MSISAWVSSGYMCDPQTVGVADIIVREDLTVDLSDPAEIAVALTEETISVNIDDPDPLQVGLTQTDLCVSLCRCEDE